MIFHFLYFAKPILLLKLTTPSVPVEILYILQFLAFVLLLSEAPPDNLVKWAAYLILSISCICAPSYILHLVQFSQRALRGHLLPPPSLSVTPKGTQLCDWRQCQRRGSVNTGCIEFFIINVVKKSFYTLWHSLLRQVNVVIPFWLKLKEGRS